MKCLSTYISESRIDEQFELLQKISEMTSKYGEDFMWGFVMGKGQKLALDFAKQNKAHEDTIQLIRDDDEYFERNVIGFFYSNKASFDDLNYFRDVMTFKTDYKNAKGTQIYHHIWAILDSKY